MKTKLKPTVTLFGCISLLLFGLYSCDTAPRTKKPTIIYVVRHAEKLNESDTSTLTEKGSRRAVALSEEMRNKGIDLIFVTKLIRTKLTARPTADLLNKRISKYDKDASIAFAKDLKKMKGKHILVVGHSDNVPAMVAELTGVQVNIPHDVFNKLFIITIRQGVTPLVRLTQRTYGEPSP